MNLLAHVVAAALVIFAFGFYFGVTGGPYIVEFLEDRLTYPYPSNEAVLEQIKEDIPFWHRMDSFTLAIELRNWSAQHTYHGSWDISTVYTPHIWEGRLYQHLNVYAQGSRGVWCTGYAHTYREILRLFEYDAYVISVGSVPDYTHAAALVKVDGKFLIIDPYFECHYLWNNGTPISWLEMIEEMEAGRFDTFYRVEVSTDGYTPSLSQVLGNEFFFDAREELLGNGTPLKASWMYEYDITTGGGRHLSRGEIRREEG